MRQRDYRAEYRHRIERASERGLTRSQARGHARAGETPIRAKASAADSRVQSGIEHFLKHGRLQDAAKAAGVSPERLRRLVHEQQLAERKGRRLRPKIREMELFTRGRRITIKVGFDAASQVGRYLNAVRRFLATNDAALLDPFVGRSVTDISGKSHPFETDPNTLYELSLTGRGTYEDVYRLTISS